MVLKPAEFEKVTQDLENLGKCGLIDIKKKKAILSKYHIQINSMMMLMYIVMVGTAVFQQINVI